MDQQGALGRTEGCCVRLACRAEALRTREHAAYEVYFLTRYHIQIMNVAGDDDMPGGRATAAPRMAWYVQEMNTDQAS